MDDHTMAKVKSGPWLYFALTLGWSWLCWIPLAFSGIHVATAAGTIIFFAGLCGPGFSAIVLTILLGDKHEKHDYWDRFTGLARITPRWGAVILLLAPLFSLLAIVTGFMRHGALPNLDTPGHYLQNPLTIIPFALAKLMYGPLPEELGWRGYALDRLQKNHRALASSLILGIVWSVWHMPMFFIHGSIMSDVFPLWSTAFWVAMGPGILATSIIMTWIYNNTQRSTLGAVIFHFMLNFTAEFLRLPGDYKSYQFIWVIVAAILIVVFSEPATFARKSWGRQVE